ncbi:MAG: protein kinase [Planctomycetales bacterium]|nr:protein kinase [Planctomycetales bacterium]MCA9166403.1 protein kinase [Planctomycetales bacterium]
MTAKRPNVGRTVKLDADKLVAVMNRCGLDVDKLAQRAALSSGTVNNVLAGKAPYRSTANRLATALGVNLDVLLEGTGTPTAAATVHEYLLLDVLTDWITASNGLRFQACRMRHLELDRQCRGKRFDLRDLPTDEEQRCRTWIKRHPIVCDAIGAHPNIVRNFTAFHDPGEGYYWVIDEWVDGVTLLQKLQRDRFEGEALRQLMLDIAHGLQALHTHDIIRRELSPASILMWNQDATAVLTDFELAKLIDRGPTVSTKDWPADPYRAPEANGVDVNYAADIYSWGRIAVHACLGELPESESERDRLRDAGLPRRIERLLESAVSPLRGERPSSIDELIPAIEKWG